jgi:hypothetical protein
MNLQEAGLLQVYEKDKSDNWDWEKISEKYFLTETLDTKW